MPIADGARDGARIAGTTPGWWGCALAYLESVQVNGPADWSERWESYMTDDRLRAADDAPNLGPQASRT